MKMRKAYIKKRKVSRAIVPEGYVYGLFDGKSQRTSAIGARLGREFVVGINRTNRDNRKRTRHQTSWLRFLHKHDETKYREEFALSKRFPPQNWEY
jgi:hypothetical protein